MSKVVNKSQCEYLVLRKDFLMDNSPEILTYNVSDRKTYTEGNENAKN